MSENNRDSDIILDPRESQLAARDFPAQAGMQRVQTKYATAIQVQNPRVLQQVDRRAMEEAALLGADAFYGWGAGKDRVEGPSVKLAMALVRCYGNCAVDLDEVQESHDAWIFTARFIDLETGFTLSRQFRQSKGWLVYGKFDEARKEDIRFQIGQSKATRNVILNAVPDWLVSRALDRAKGGVREGIQKAITDHGIEKVIAKALKTLEELGVPTERVLASMGRAAPGALTLEDLVIMQGGAAALRSGAETAEGAFPVKDQQGDAAPVGTAAERLASTLRGQGGTSSPSTAETPDATGGSQEPGKGMADSGHAGSLLPDDAPTNKPKGRR